MKTIKQTIRNAVLGAFLVFGLFFAAAPLTASPASAACGGAQTSIINCGEDNTDKDGDGKVDYNETGVWAILVIAIKILTAGVGVLALAGIVYGAILYTSAGGNAEQVKKAYGIFTNVVIGVIAFAGMWTLLNFLIPGGVNLL